MMNDTVAGAEFEQAADDTNEGMDSAAQEADMLSGFDDSTATPNQSDKQTDDANVQQQETEKKEPQYKQITTEEYERLIGAANAIDEIRTGSDKAFGKIGGVERSLQELQDRLSKGAPKGEPIQATEADFEELIAEYGSEIGNLQITGLNRILSKMGVAGSAPLDTNAIGELVNQHLQVSNESIIDSIATQIEQRNELKAVGRVHPDWQEVGNTDEFVTWVQSLPEPEQKRIYEANAKYDSVELISAFDKYKNFIKSKATQNNRQEILEDAITEKGDGNHAPASKKSAEAELLDGFNS